MVVLAAACSGEKQATKPGSGSPTGDPFAQNEEVTTLYFDAATLQAQNEYALAAEKYRELLALDKDNHAAAYNLALVLREEGQLAEALPYARKSVEEHQENFWYYILLADLQKQNDQLPKAIKTMEDATDRFPKEVDLKLRLSDLYVMNEDYEKVLELFEAIERRTGENEVIAQQRKRIYMLMDKPERAAEELRQLIRENPGNNEYYYQLHDLYISTKQPDKAIQVLEELYKVDPRDGKVIFKLVNHYQQTGQQAKAKEMMNSAFESPQVPLEAKVQFLLKLMLEQDTQAESDRIQQLIYQLYTSDPDNAMLLTLMGDRAMAMQQPDSARFFFRKALDKDQLNRQVWEQLIQTDLRIDSMQALKNDTEEALIIYPNHLQFNYYNGLANYQLGAYEDAVRPLEKALKLAREDNAYKAQLHTLLGDVHNQLDDLEQAMEHYEQALMLDPGNVLAMNNFAYFLAVRDTNLDRALELIQEVIRKEPRNAAYMDTYGWVYFKQGDYQNARKWVEKSFRASPSGEVAEHLGDIYFRLENPEKAMKYWKKAQELGVETPELKRKIESGKL